MARNLSYLNRYFVMYPHKATVKIWRKVTVPEKWENEYLRVKNARDSRALRQALDPGQYWLALLRRQNLGEKCLPPPTRSWIRYCISTASHSGLQVPLLQCWYQVCFPFRIPTIPLLTIPWIERLILSKSLISWSLPHLSTLKTALRPTSSLGSIPMYSPVNASPINWS